MLGPRELLCYYHTLSIVEIWFRWFIKAAKTFCSEIWNNNEKVYLKDVF